MRVNKALFPFSMARVISACSCLLFSAGMIIAQTGLIVDAKANSSTGGKGAFTGVYLCEGQNFKVLTQATQLWSAGEGDWRKSNANGIRKYHSQAGLRAPFASLVGRIGKGPYFLIGASFDGKAQNAGNLELFFWDSFPEDNTGRLRVEVQVDEENGSDCETEELPGTLALSILDGIGEPANADIKILNESGVLLMDSRVDDGLISRELPAGRYEIRISAPTFGAPHVIGVAVEPGDKTEVDCCDLGRLGFDVLNISGKPVNARVELWRVKENAETPFAVFYSESGFVDVPAGRYEARISDSRDRPEKFNSLLGITVSSGELLKAKVRLK